MEDYNKVLNSNVNEEKEHFTDATTTPSDSIDNSSGSYAFKYGYTFGAAMTYAQSSIIKMGNQLESDIQTFNGFNTNTNRGTEKPSGTNFISNLPVVSKSKKNSNEVYAECASRATVQLYSLSDGTYMIDKDNFFNSGLCIRKGQKFNNVEVTQGIQPDIIIMEKNGFDFIFHLVELKLGHSFDTKKCEGELKHINLEEEYLKEKFHCKNDSSEDPSENEGSLKVDYHFASWFCNDIGRLKTGTKGRLNEHLMIRDDLVKLTKLDYESVRDSLSSRNENDINEFLRLLINPDNGADGYNASLRIIDEILKHDSLKEEIRRRLNLD